MKPIKLEPIHTASEDERTSTDEKSDTDNDQKPSSAGSYGERWQRVNLSVCQISVAELQIVVNSITNDNYLDAAKAMLKAACDQRYLTESNVFSPDDQMFYSATRSKELNTLRKLYEVNTLVLSSLLMTPVKMDDNITYNCDTFPYLKISKSDDDSIKCQQCLTFTPRPNTLPVASKFFSFDGCSYDETSLYPIQCTVDARINYLCITCSNRIRLYHSLRHAFYSVLNLNIRRIALRYSETEEGTPKSVIAQHVLDDYRRTDGEYCEIFWQDLRCDWFDALHL